MSDLVETIRIGIAADATTEARAAGAAACRAALALLEPVPVPTLPPDAVPKLLGMLRGMDLDQLLGIAIDRLQAAGAARGDGATAARPQSINFHMVPLPRALGGGT